MRKVSVLMIVLLLVTGALFAQQGMWKDGTYTAQGNAFDHGYKNSVRIVVENGYITDVHFDAIAEKGGKTKYVLSTQGEYGMLEKGNAQAAWYEQADRAAAYLVKVQDPAQLTRSNSAVDAISGVSIDVGPQFELAVKALANARR